MGAAMEASAEKCAYNAKEATSNRAQCSVSTSLPIDCAICMGTIEKAACGRCMHHFCYECLLSATRAARAEGRPHNCPICRQSLDFISKDAQYDEMIAVIVASLEEKSDVPFRATPGEKATIIHLDFATGTGSAGVCLQTVNGPGVRISKVLKSGRFYMAGFRPDDLIIEINGVACHDVESAVSVINREQARRGMLNVRVLQECEKQVARVTFRELELPRKTHKNASTKSLLALNEHQADPGIWLEA